MLRLLLAASLILPGALQDPPKRDREALVDLRLAFREYWKKNNPENKPKGSLTYDGNHWTEAGPKYVSEQMLKKFK